MRINDLNKKWKLKVLIIRCVISRYNASMVSI